MRKTPRIPVLKTMLPLLVAALFSSCTSPSTSSSAPEQPAVVKADQAFASGGSIDMQLSGGNYEIRPASGDRIRLSFEGNIGNAAGEVTTAGTQAKLSVKDTPNSNFRATIEVPRTSDLVLHLSGGNLKIGAITGSKNIDSKAGNVEIAVGNANDYASVDATVMVGNLDAGPFGSSNSGLSPHLVWSGNGKYTLHANLGAGNLELRSAH